MKKPARWAFLLLLFSLLLSACVHDGGAPVESHASDLSGVFSGDWGTLEFLQDKEVLVHFNEEQKWILRGRPNDAVYRYVFTLGSFGETGYDSADGFQLIHTDHRENLTFLCPEFPSADRIPLQPLTSDAEIGVFQKQ